MGIDDKLLTEFKNQFDADSTNQVIKGAIAKVGISDASLDSIRIISDIFIL